MPPEIMRSPSPPVPTGIPPTPLSKEPNTSAEPFSRTSMQTVLCGSCTSTLRAGKREMSLPPMAALISIEVIGYFL